ncbi:hexokinase type 2-like [Musca autumnalis]|uniref:hexokinase type 2-like n=1 Tax=Musca autumnalis TaxID=221902 RepID=UPI003CEB3A93
MSNSNIIEETEPQETPEEISSRLIKEICQPLMLENEKLQQIKEAFLIDLQMGLCKYSHGKSMSKCWLTFVQELPGGCENGTFLALDWSGGINFRFVAIYLKCKKDFHMDSKIYEIPGKLLNGPGVDVFDFIAESLSAFVKTFQVIAADDESLPMAVNFEFQVKQSSINKAELVAWDNGINCPDVVGRDVLQMLREAIERRGEIKLQMLILVRQPIGTLMNGAWHDQNCKISLNVGAASSCKACYVEKVTNMSIYHNPKGNTIPTMLICCEWGSLGDNGKLEFLQSRYDKEIDAKSQNPNAKLLEKLLNLENLGELLRLLLMDCLQAELLCKGNISEQLRQEGSFKTEYMFLIATQPPQNHDITREIFEKLGYKNPTDFDCEQMYFICNTILRRSAYLVAAIIACLIERVGDPYTVVAIDGPLSHLHEIYNCLIAAKLSQLVRPEHKFRLMLSEDGSGRGAALTSAVINSKCQAEMLKMKLVSRSSTRKSNNGGAKRNTENLF